VLTHDASPKTSKARKTAGRVAARKRRACQWEWPGGRAIEANAGFGWGGGGGEPRERHYLISLGNGVCCRQHKPHRDRR